MIMNIYLKKRKKSVFDSYKTVRASICLNKMNRQHMDYFWQEAIVVTNYENCWLEQAKEVKSELSPFNQTFFKHDKMIIKWWENN